MSALSAPLTPPDCDLRGYGFMPFYGARLFNAAFEARANDAAFRAAAHLWWACWLEVPAASLPDDDAVLASLAGLGGRLAAWRRLRPVALTGFVACGDGRLYHAELAPLAIAAYRRRLMTTAERRSERVRLAAWRARNASQNNRESLSDRDNETAYETPYETPAYAVREESTGNERTPSLRSGGTRLPPAWQPSAAGGQFARALGLDPERLSAAFGDYWHAMPGTRGRKADWEATWRNWCRREAEHAGQPTRGKLGWVMERMAARCARGAE